jgi:hypothetical protein
MASSSSSQVPASTSLPIKVTQHDPATSAKSLKNVKVGNLSDVLARSDESHGPYECEVKELSRVKGDYRAFVITANRAVDVVNVSSESVRVKMDVMDAGELEYIVHAGGYLRGFYGDCAVTVSGTGMNFGGFRIGSMNGSMTGAATNPKGSSVTMNFF